MPDTHITLADLAKINDMNLADIEVTDLLQDAPLMNALAAGEASNGTQHKYTKETAAPVVGFRAPNAGRDNDASEDTLVTVDLKIIDGSNAIDVAIADGYKNGPEALIARESRRHLKAAFFAAEQQFVNGADADSDGFVGLADAFDELSDAMVIDAGGTSASTGSSVWLIRTNDDGVDATAIIGGQAMGDEGNIVMGETVVTPWEDSSGKKFPAYYTPITGWLGLQLGSAWSIARIANITADSGKTCTDDLIYQALELFPAARQPNLIAMSRRSLRQLRDSRTATNATGAPAPRPTDVEGIPIVTTDAITNTEELLTSGS